MMRVLLLAIGLAGCAGPKALADKYVELCEPRFVHGEGVDCVTVHMFFMDDGAIRWSLRPEEGR